MSYSIESIKQAGVAAVEAKIADNDPTYLNRVAQTAGVAELNSAAFIAVCMCLKDGQWSKSTAMSAIKIAESDAEFEDIQLQLILANVLTLHGKTVFTPAFLLHKEQIAKHMIKYAPALMLPVTDPQSWVYGESHQADLNLVKGQPNNQVPSKVISAVNKLQDVRFTVSTVILDHLIAKQVKLSARAAKVKSITAKVHQELRTLETKLEFLQGAIDAGPVGFHITMDFRGRMYYRGGISTPQGADFDKAVWQFANSQPLGKGGKVAMAIHFANVYGKDKLSLQDRITWANSLDGGHKVSGYVAKGSELTTADKPWQAMVAAAEWYRLAQWEAAGNSAEDFMSNLVCHQDGTCNGLQHGAALTGCRDTAESVNCTAATRHDVPQDVYGKAAQVFIQNDEFCVIGAVVSKYGRKVFKKPVMVASYGAGKRTMAAKFLEEMNAEDQETIKRSAGQALPDYVLSAVKSVASATISLNNELQSGIKGMDDPCQAIKWITEDGFTVIQEARTKDDSLKHYVGAGRYIVRTDPIDAMAQVLGISANFVHSIDAAHLRAVVRDVECDLVTVHDSIGSHAGSFMDVYRSVRKQFAVVHAHNQVASLNNLNGLDIQLPSLGDYDPAEVVNAPYFFS